MKSTRWQMIPTDETIVSALSNALELEPLYCRLLAQRRITDPEEAKRFFRPSLRDLHNPFLMKDMDIAVERLDVALRRGERILLYGDYDVDGTTSVALMYDFLCRFYRNLDFYLPDRDKEGYGVSLAGVEYAKQEGITLIIAMDCGIKAHKAVEKANNYGIDFIVCDHHVPEGDLPAAVANLDPKRPDCPYPFKELSGCGIAFKLAQALALHNNMPAEELEDLLDLVAVSIACDIVPMDGENRILEYHGLRRLNRSPRMGFWALIERLQQTKPLDINELVFGLGPVINAAGRLGDAREAVRLLLSADKNSALEQTDYLLGRNRERREMDLATTEEARQRFKANTDWAERKSIVLYEPAWHKGVIGIASSRLTQEFYKPSVIMTDSNGIVVGSARSVQGFDLYEALRDCEDMFHSYGGHAHAAGLQMPIENVPAFKEKFEQLVNERLLPEDVDPLIEICAEIKLQDINRTLVRRLQRFAPFGPENRAPVFMVCNVVDSGYSRLLDNNHVRLSVCNPGSRASFAGIGFGFGADFMEVKDGPFDLAFTLKEDEWKGQKNVTMYIKAIRASVT
jgi:single-stranded-DNA-specific exonuclease